MLILTLEFTQFVKKKLSLPLLADANKSDEAQKMKIERYLISKDFRMTLFFRNRKQNKLTKLRM